jgi:hypothetical protein
MTTSDALTPNERTALAREVAADGRARNRDYKFRCPECSELFFDSVVVETVRGAFIDGWNAAMAYVEEQRAVTEDDSNGN